MQNSRTRNKNGYNLHLTVLSNPKFATEIGIHVKFQKKKKILNPFIIKNRGYDPKKLAIDKNFVQFWSSFYIGQLKNFTNFFIFFNPFPADIFSRYSSQDWCLFSIFRVYLWRNTQRYIENNVCSIKQKGCNLPSIFLCYLLGPESKMAETKGQKL